MASKITAAQYLSKIKISGFQFCDMLNNAIFDAMVHLHPLNGSIAGLNPLVQSVISLLDTKAQEITKFIQVKFEGVNILEAKRYACYAVAEGNNPLGLTLAIAALYSALAPTTTFHSPLPAIHVGTPKVTPSRPRYLMAFLIMLSGFWELLDMAQWDYIVNLSNYDWPLRNNVDMHAALERHPGFSWIDYWNDTEAIAERSLRPHLARADHSGVYHPPELGITSWPFSHWRAYKQMQWMVLARDAVSFLRSDKHAINYLAFMEHTLMPEESYFATALVNSQFSYSIKAR
ncbi:hypothetical protein BASA81_016110 [Batrachochytrium salamandrivorans]|nr:hypothetical protein BASA81_016110 [Batrachochytrium salamandrivorans]